MIGEEVRKLKNEEITAELGKLRMSLFDLRSQVVTDKVGDTSMFRKARKDIARLLTEHRARQIAKGSKAAAPKAAPAKAPKKAAAPRKIATKATAGKGRK